MAWALPDRGAFSCLRHRHDRLALAQEIATHLGVELGQALFLVAVLAAVMLGKRLMAPSEPQRLARFVSIAASVIGAYWFVARVVG